MLRNYKNDGHSSFAYDFAIQGGAIGSINLRNSLPQYAVVTGYWIKIINTFTSGGAAVVKFQLQTGTIDVITPLFANMTAGAVLTGNIVTAITVDQLMLMNISAFALTGGKLVGYINYIPFQE